ncbi:hypothetical protein Hdeb2414_s0016g00473221 [Helianthus debilis subsp. tardiflorus]
MMLRSGSLPVLFRLFPDSFDFRRQQYIYKRVRKKERTLTPGERPAMETPNSRTTTVQRLGFSCS